MLIFEAMSGKSFKSVHREMRGRLSSALNLASSEGPSCSSGVRTAARFIKPDGINLNVSFPVLANIRLACTGYDYRLRRI